MAWAKVLKKVHILRGAWEMVLNNIGSILTRSKAFNIKFEHEDYFGLKGPCI